ncbi:MAG: substrate-binding domain-containing protein [Anaerolineales bacterium]|nr:substrate-binding domain-containing protein [Anaerolineales bacterium]
MLDKKTNDMGEKKFMKTYTLRICCLVLILSTLLSACSQPSEAVQPDNAIGTLEGTISVSGAWALYPLMVRWSEEFQALYPNVQFDISAGGAGKGMADALAGAVDIGMVSREIYQEEIDKGAFWLPVTKDAVFVTLNRENPVWEEIYKQGLKQETLVGIFITGEVTTWGQVIGNDKVTDPIHVFTRSDACGAADTWAAYLGSKQEDLMGVGVYGDPGLLEAVTKDPLGIGYNNLNFAFDADTGIPVENATVAPLDVDEDGQAGPEEIYDTKEQAVKAVAMNEYPSPPARDLNLVTNGAPTGPTRTFIRWILTDGQQFVEETGYITLSESSLASGLEKLD